MRNLKSMLRIGLGLLVLIAFVGCNIDLNVENKNAPDQERALSTAQDIENLIAGTFLDWWYGTHYYAPSMTLSTMADEGTSSWGNFAMREMSSEPRVAWNNSITYDADYQLVNRGPWYNLYSAISSAADGIRAIDGGLVIEGEDGSDQSMRAKAYAKFVMALAHGWISCFFDKGFILDETIDLETTTLAVSTAEEIWDAAKDMFQDCIDLCNANTFTTKTTWILDTPLTQDEMKALCYSYMARYEASFGRTVAERDAADWASIKTWADNGITTDWYVGMDGGYWWSGLHYLGIAEGWMRSDNWNLGPGDNSGTFDAWVATPVANRTSIVITSDDLRLTSGDSTGTGVFPRVGTDYYWYYPVPYRPDRGTYHFSYYEHIRYRDHLLSGAATPVPDMLAAEMNLLKAEYWLRQGNAANAAIEIDKTRTTRGGLASTAGAAIGSVSDDADYLGSMWAMFKYEKHIELDRTGVGLAWMDDRGWGDLVTGTPIHFPIPARELEVLQMPGYTFGGSGDGAAPKMMPHIPAKY